MGQQVNNCLTHLCKINIPFLNRFRKLINQTASLH
jgi:hypothetical protein